MSDPYDPEEAAAESAIDAAQLGKDYWDDWEPDNDYPDDET